MNILKKKLIPCLFTVLFVSFISSCSKKVSFVTSTVVPAAEGKIDISRDDNKNYVIEINIKRLAQPSRLQPSKKTYVVWMEAEDNGVKNLGQLNSATGFFTGNLTATLNTATPYKPRRVFITAEDEGTIQYPGTQVVLTTKSF